MQAIVYSVLLSYEGTQDVQWGEFQFPVTVLLGRTMADLRLSAMALRVQRLRVHV